MSDEEITQAGVTARTPLPLFTPKPRKNGKPAAKDKDKAKTKVKAEEEDDISYPPLYRDDEEDEEEEEKEDEHQETVAAPRLTIRPLTPTMTQVRQMAATQHHQNAEEFETFLSGLEFDGGTHAVTVSRIEPEYDPISGRKISGYLEKYTRAISLEEIRSKYGGGRYQLLVHGPGFNGRVAIKGKKVVEIAGDPTIMPGRQNGQQQAQQGLPAGVESIVKETLQNAERQIDRASEETREMKQMLYASMAKGDESFKSMFAAIANPGQNQQMIMEERRLAEQRLTEERRMFEARLLAERETRQREQDAAERRHQEMLASLKNDQERLRLDAKEAGERAREQFQLQLKMIEKQDVEKEARSLKMSELYADIQNKHMVQQQQMQQMQMEAMRSAEQMQRDILLKQLEGLQKQQKSSPIEDLLKAKQAIDTLTGKDGGDMPTWERILDKASEAFPGVLAAAAAFRGSGSPQGAPTTQQRVLPGSIAVIDENEERPRRRRLRPKQSDTRPTQPATATATATAAATATERATATEPANDLKEISYPPPGTELSDVLVRIVKNIDYAIANDFSVDTILDIVKKHPPEVTSILKAQDVDALLKTIEERAPSSWRINSLDGQAKVRELHARL